MTLVPILDTPELTVYGPPDTVSVVTDIGPAGDRGSQLFANLGHPDIYTSTAGSITSFIGTPLKTRDMYYRVDSDSWYQWLNGAWQLRSGLRNVHKLVKTATFTAGVATLTISTLDLWGDLDITTIVANNIVVHVQAIDATPAFLAVTDKTLDNNVPKNLILDLAGFHLNMGTGLPYLISGSVTVNLIISLV